jgi:hypothetical protein
MSHFEKLALERLSQISTPAFDAFQQINQANPTHRTVI